VVLVTSGVAVASLASAKVSATHIAEDQIVYFPRVMVMQVSNSYASPIAGVFMIPLGTNSWGRHPANKGRAPNQ